MFKSQRAYLRFSSDYYLSVAVAFEDCQCDSPLATAESQQEPAADALSGHFEDVVVVAKKRIGACCGHGASPAIFHDVAAVVMGCILSGALGIFSGKLDGALGRFVLSTACDGPASSMEIREARAAHHSRHDLVADIESVAANDDECLRPPSDADASLRLSSSCLQAVSYPLTPRRLIALKDRNELSSHYSDAKLQVPASSEPALHAVHAESGGQ